jgi:5'-methylthioadenosine nucleosidase
MRTERFEKKSQPRFVTNVTSCALAGTALEFTHRQPKRVDLIKRVAVIFAMHDEALPFLKVMGVSAVKRQVCAGQPVMTFSRTVGEIELAVFLNGKDPVHKVDRVGTDAAALTTFIAIHETNPDLIINAGTAGGSKARGGRIGEVYLAAERAVFHDRRISVPGFSAYGRGEITLPPLKMLPTRMDLKTGVLSTGNSLDMIAAERRELARSAAALKDMEGATIVKVAQSFGTPVIVMKAITDLFDVRHKNTAAEFNANFGLAVRNLQNKLVELVQLLSTGVRLRDL